MKLFIISLLSLFLAHSLFALSPLERSHLLAQVKATKSLERKALNQRIVRFKQSRNLRSRSHIRNKNNLKFKQRLRRQMRLKKTRPKRVP